MDLIITDVTVIDPVVTEPRKASIWIRDGMFHAIGDRASWDLGPDVDFIQGQGRYAIPGLMNANVHLLFDVRLETLARYEPRLEDLITEAAQIALANGVTTVFDTWGPLRPLLAVRDRINDGSLTASRIFCGGNIIGLDGPFSQDFFPKAAEQASAGFLERINRLWTENVGPELSWMTPDEVGREIVDYIAKGVDFVKFASSEHRMPMENNAFLALSPAVQSVIVNEAKRAGLTSQAHTTAVEALRVAIEAGCDLIQHINLTGPTPIPDSTIELLVSNGVSATVFPLTQRRFRTIVESGDILLGKLFTTISVDINVEKLVTANATLLLATDGGIFPYEVSTDPAMAFASGDENLFDLATGHFHWLSAMEEKGLSAQDGLRAATINVARAYGRDHQLGSIEVGKIADLLLLDANPLDSAANYRRIDTVIQQGKVIDVTRLPEKRIFTAPFAGGYTSSHPVPPRLASVPPCCR